MKTNEIENILCNYGGGITIISIVIISVINSGIIIRILCFDEDVQMIA